MHFSPVIDPPMTAPPIACDPYSFRYEIMGKSGIQLEFSGKYDRVHAGHYLAKHQDGFWRRLSHHRDEQLVRRALKAAGNPGLVLDLPCGAGRFWPVLAEKPGRIIIGADSSQDMLDVALSAQPAELIGRVRPMRTSAFEIDLPDNAVDSVFCMRLLHHVGVAEHRLAMLREFQRVTRDSLIISLWVDGNFKAWRRKQLDARRDSAGRNGERNRFVLPVHVVESEFEQSGFRIEKRLDFLPFYAMWRVYFLRKD
jgi:SAM-dependent methyltransferase